mmetsp:Transcript_39146/g.90669  ORF Transcript_39146/g.90669 Transcript_39146/m.90669 type:complete len:213 (+) Transcript_39146:362-1000(+)
MKDLRKKCKGSFWTESLGYRLVQQSRVSSRCNYTFGGVFIPAYVVRAETTARRVPGDSRLPDGEGMLLHGWKKSRLAMLVTTPTCQPRTTNVCKSYAARGQRGAPSARSPAAASTSAAGTPSPTASMLWLLARPIASRPLAFNNVRSARVEAKKILWLFGFTPASSLVRACARSATTAPSMFPTSRSECLSARARCGSKCGKGADSLLMFLK